MGAFKYASSVIMAMSRKGKGRHRELVRKDPDVRRWYQNLARKARTTADNYLRVLGLTLGRMGLSPAEYVALEPRERDDRLDDYVEWMLEKGLSASYAGVVRKAVASWLRFNGEDFTRRIEVPNPDRHPSGRGQMRIPAQEELRTVLHLAPPRTQAMVALIAFSGVRPQVLGAYRGVDGLRVRDLPDARLRDGRLEFERVPAMVRVHPRLSKTAAPYFTFLGPEGCEIVSAYFETREEELGPDSPLIAARWKRKERAWDEAFLGTGKVGDAIRVPMRRAGLEEPPYIWRSYFSSRAMLAESRGLLRDWREFMMGHTSDISRRYSMDRRLPEDTVEAMRDGYAEALEHLETTPRHARQDPTERLLRVILKAAGHGEEELAEMDLRAMSDEEIVALLEGGPGARLATNGGGPRQRIVALEELPVALEEGWTYRDSLADGRVVVELGEP